MSNTEATARDEFFDSLLGDFLDESGQLLDRLNENLLQLDDWVRALDDDHRERCDDELMNDMFRSAHSLKGLSAMLGLDDINNLTHKVENVFDAARKDELIIGGDVVELMFQAVDRLVAMVDGLKDADSEPVACETVVSGIQNVLQAAGVERKQLSQADAENALGDLMDEARAEEAATPEIEAVADETTATSDDTGAESADATLQNTPAEPEVDYFADLTDETEIPSKYLSIFIDEAFLSLDNLTETLLTFEGGDNRSSLETVLIVSHRIKGSAASVGLNRPAKLAHLMEDLLQNLVDTGGTLSADVTDALLACTDALRQYIEDLRGGGGKPDQFNTSALRLLATQNKSKAPTSIEAEATTEPSPCQTEPPSTSSNPLSIGGKLTELGKKKAPDHQAYLLGVLTFEARLPLVGLKARLVFEKLSHLGELFHFNPPVEKVEDMEQIDRIEFALATDCPLDQVQAQLRIGGVEQVALEAHGSEEQEAKTAASATPVEPASQAKKQPAPKAQPSRGSQPQARTENSSRPTETLRVDIDRLDQLMNLAGQLVISKARFTLIGDGLKAVVGNRQASQSLNNVFNTLDKMASSQQQFDDKQRLQAELENLRSQARRVQNDLEAVRREVEVITQVRGSVNDLNEAIHQFGRVTDGIQQSVMDTRMVPIGPLFGRFRRVVRDITRSNGKSIRLEIRGEKTELDKRMIDELGDPLIHMVRNSADHGIESPEVREAAGKSPEGTVTLDAFHRGNSIIIEVSDDGKGLDTEPILRKALEKGLITEADAEKMTPHQIYQLIWEPGLSTAEKVTEVSGRGMGMDIVKSKIEDLNGMVDLNSVPGQGTTLSIKLPLTLAILPSLMVEVDGDIFAMPMESVVEIVSIKTEDLSTVHGKWTAQIRGRVISLANLNEVFAWHGEQTEMRYDECDEITLVVVNEGTREIGLAVHRVIGEEDVVIKSMAENYKNVAGIAGASILGDGRVSLILDVIALIDMASTLETVEVS